MIMTLYKNYYVISMECTRCMKILDKDKFEFKNKEKKIYYLHCIDCRMKVTKNPEKKTKEKESYEMTKLSNVIECSCGCKYVAFRDYHIMRHNASQRHIMSQKKKK